MAWLVVPLTAVVMIEVIARYVFNNPTTWAYNMNWILHSTLFLLGGAYTLYHRRHVRIDILYLKLSVRKQALLDIVFYVIFLPVIGRITWEGIRFTSRAFRVHEMDQATLWQIPLGPLKLLIVIGFLLLWFQGLSELVRSIRRFRGGEA